jgi:hypothetical protein
MMKYILGATIFCGLGAFWIAHRNTPRMAAMPISNPQAPAAVLAKQPDQKPFMFLAKGVQEYCLDQYDLTNCMAYAVKCGKDCASLLPPSFVARLFNDYNKYLLSRGEQPLRPLRIPASRGPKTAPIKSTLKSSAF